MQRLGMSKGQKKIAIWMKVKMRLKITKSGVLQDFRGFE